MSIFYGNFPIQHHSKVNTDDATATKRDVLFGKTAYNKYGKFAGEFPLRPYQEKIQSSIGKQVEPLSVVHGDNGHVADVWIYEYESWKHCLMYSEDSVDWRNVFTLDDYNTCLLSCLDGTFIFTTYDGINIQSEDGINWEIINVDCAGCYMISNGINWFAIGASSDHTVRISTNKGKTWEYCCYIDALDDFYCYCFDGSKIILIGYDSIFHSEDGVTWECVANAPKCNSAWCDICYKNGTYVMTEFEGNNIAYSYDGITFTIIEIDNNISFNNYYWDYSYLVCNDKYFVTFGYNYDNGNYALLYSVNGIDWQIFEYSAATYEYANISVVLQLNNNKFAIFYGHGLVEFFTIENDTVIFEYVEDNSMYQFVKTEGDLILCGQDGHKKTLYEDDYGRIGFVGDYDTSEATIDSLDVPYGEIAYGKDGKITGQMPISYHSGSLDNHSVPYSAPSPICYGNGMFVVTNINSDSISYSYDGLNWNYANGTSGNGNGYESCAYGNGVFVAIGIDQAKYSTNGIDWVDAELDLSIHGSFRHDRLFYGNDRFIAFPAPYEGGTFMYSLDGKVWYDLKNLPYLDYQRGCYGDGKFVVVADEGHILCSTNGINWDITANLQDGHTDFDYYHSICYFKGQFFVFSYYNVAVSTDCITWERTPLPIQCFAACCNDEKIVITGYGVAAYSQNGKTWFSSDTYTSRSIALHSVCYGNNMFIASNAAHKGAVTYSTVLSYSHDGVTWNSTCYIGETKSSNYPIYLTYNNSTPQLLIRTDNGLKFEGHYNTQNSNIIAEDVSCGKITYNKNGMIGGYSPFSYISEKNSSGAPQYFANKQRINKLIYNNGKYFATLGEDGLATSIDCMNWQDVGIDEDFYCSDICYGNGIYIMTESSSAYNKVAYSIDGINWNFVNLQKSYGSSICYGNGIFILYGGYNSNIAAYSNDGINWTEITLPVSKTLKDIYYEDGIFIATINSTLNIVLRSTDGITWTEIYLPQSIEQPEICYGNGQFVIMDYYMNTVQCSQDGIDWNAYSTQFSGSLRWLFFANNKFIAFNKGMLLYSENGITWQLAGTVDKYLDYVCNTGDMFIASTTSGYLAYSYDGIHWFDNTLIYQLENTIFGTYLQANNGRMRHAIFNATNNTVEFDDEIKLLSLDIIQQPTKLHYLGGDTADCTGASCIATYTHGMTRTVEEFDCIPKVITNDTAEILICLTEGGRTCSVTVPITVTKTVKVPEQIGGWDYTGDLISPIWDNYDNTCLEIGGATSAIEAGTYTITFTPINNYCWLDGSSDTVEVEWNIYDVIENVLVDFEYKDNNDGTYTITNWKGTLNGSESTEIFVPNDPRLIM